MEGNKSKKTIDELIQHMDNKGIKFDLISKSEAMEFLENNNYYMKLSSYRINFEKYEPNSLKAGQYINLDFGHLKELSTLDRHLRYLLLQMCMDIEHYMKTKLITHVSKNEDEDGYDIIKQFLNKKGKIEKDKIIEQFLIEKDKNEKILNRKNGKILNRIEQHRSGTYCKDLIDKYHPHYPVWVFVELISFGDLVYLSAFYNQTYDTEVFYPVKNKFINTVRDIRNACAHSNCLLNTITKPVSSGGQADNRIRDFVKEHAASPEISRSSINKYLHNEFSYNMLTLLYVYSNIVPSEARNKMFHDLKDFINNRCCRHADWFASQEKILSLHSFWRKFIDNLVEDD